jgi:hypothetical protein
MARRSMRSALAGRGFLLFPAAAFAVHQLRYRIGYGSQADQALSAQGHGYLESLAPWVVLLLALALGTFLARLARASAGRATTRARRSFGGLWSLTALSLVATYASQEALEGLFATGHPGGLAGIVGHGGWWAFALAVVAGFVVATLLRIAFVVVDVVARVTATRPSRTSTLFPRRPAAFLPGRLAPLAGASAGRAPPAACCAALA